MQNPDTPAQKSPAAHAASVSHGAPSLPLPAAAMHAVVQPFAPFTGRHAAFSPQSSDISRQGPERFVAPGQIAPTAARDPSADPAAGGVSGAQPVSGTTTVPPQPATSNAGPIDHRARAELMPTKRSRGQNRLSYSRGQMSRGISARGLAGVMPAKGEVPQGQKQSSGTVLHCSASR